MLKISLTSPAVPIRVRLVRPALLALAFFVAIGESFAWSAPPGPDEQSQATDGRYLQIHADDGIVTLTAHNVSVEAALAALAGATELDLQIRGDLGGRRSDWTFRELPLKEALQAIVGGNGWVLAADPSANRRQKGRTLIVVATSEKRESMSPSGRSAVVTSQLASRCSAGAQALPPPESQTAGARPDADKALVEGLSSALREGSVVDARSAIAAMEMLDPDTATQELAAGLGTKAPEVRSEIVRALGHIGTDESIRVLAQVLYGDSDPALRKQAIQALSSEPNDLARLFIDNRFAPSRLGTRTASGSLVVPNR